MNDFKIRPYSKSELARLYFPYSPSVDAAVRNFYNMLARNGPLMRELRNADYRAHARHLSVRQVRIIVKHLEEP